MTVTTAAVVLLSYILGCFPSGKLVAGLYKIRLEKAGSGNVGATNVARVIGKKAGILVLLADITKGAAAVLVTGLLTNNADLMAIAAVAVTVGHCFSVPGVLKGGKGVATAVGAILTLSWPVALVAIITFVLLFVWRRIVSLASVIAAGVAAAASWILLAEPSPQIAITAIGILVILRHNANIKRLLAGSEKPFV